MLEHLVDISMKVITNKCQQKPSVRYVSSRSTGEGGGLILLNFFCHY